MSTFASPRKPNLDAQSSVHRGRTSAVSRLSRQKIAQTKKREAIAIGAHQSLQHTQPWLPSSPLSLSSRPASPRPRRAPRAPSAPPPSTVSRSRSPRYARAVGPSVAEKHRFTARAIFFIFSSRIGARVAGHGRARGTKSSLWRAGGTRGIPSWRSRSGDPVSRLEGPTTGPDPDRSRSGVAALSPDVSPVAFVETQTSCFFVFCRTRTGEFVKSRRRRTRSSRRVATTTDFDRLSRLTRRLTDRPFTPFTPLSLVL